MTELRAYSFAPVDLDTLAGATGRVAVLIPEDGTLSRGAECLNGLTGGALARVIADDAWAKKKSGDVVTLAFPAGMAAEAVDIVRLAGDPSVIDARNAGAKLAKAAGKSALTVLCENGAHPAEFAMGLALRGYDFAVRKSAEVEPLGAAVIMCDNPEQANTAAVATRAVAEGIVFTRDLVSEPANVLTTTEFADRLVALTDLGVEVEVLEEDELAKLGMGALLGVGMGSAMPSKVVIMRWNGGTGAPLALVGKGVVFDTGGISLKPAPGMEDMTMDMGGAGVVSGVMKTLALRKAKANVVGLVGLVENMPSSTAQRPGDIVTSMKGDTIEVLNTDAEGRLVLADVMWHAQISEKPRAMIDLATLTGAVIIALGHDHAGVFSNNTGFANDFLTAAKTEGEGAWQLPLAQVYDDLLKSAKADIKNIGGRAAGSITAAQFLQRFVKDDLPWIHLDIAGVAQDTKETALAPKGATGWGVLALDRLVRNTLETDAE